MRSTRVILALSAASILGLVAATSCDAGRGKDALSQRTIEASGRAEVVAAPDRASLVAAVVTRARTAKQASQENAARIGSVVKRLRNLAGKDGKVSTQSYDLRAEYDWVQKNGQRERELLGYVASNTVQVETGQLDKLGAIIDGAVGAGANELRSIRFFLSNDDELRRDALLEAGRRARDKADTIAEALGVELGPLLHASSEPRGGNGPRPFENARSFAAADSSAATSIEPGEVTFFVDLHAVFGIR